MSDLCYRCQGQFLLLLGAAVAVIIAGGLVAETLVLLVRLMRRWGHR